MHHQLSGDSPKLDFLRTIAVSLVVGAHLFMFMGDKVFLGKLQPSLLGVLGVVLFFVHTSLVLMLSLERQTQNWGHKNWVWAFYLRRIFRIYPLSIAAVLMTYYFSLPLGELKVGELIQNPNQGWGHLLANILLVQNFLKESNIIGPLWSLPLEMQMYLALPLCYWFGKKFTRASTMHLLWAYFALVAFVLSPKIVKFNELSSYWNIPNLLFYLPCFWAGIIAWRAHKEPREQLPFYYFPIALTVISILFMFSYDKTKYLFSAYACAAILPFITEPTHKTFNKICHWIAKYSYGIYLFHYFSMWLGFQYFSGQNPIFQWSVFALSLIGISVVSYHFLEQPFIKLGNRMASHLAKTKSPDLSHKQSAA